MAQHHILNSSLAKVASSKRVALYHHLNRMHDVGIVFGRDDRRGGGISGLDDDVGEPTAVGQRHGALRVVRRRVRHLKDDYELSTSSHKGSEIRVKH